MRWSDIPLHPPRTTLRQFAGLWLAVFASLACWQGLVRHHGGAAVALAVLALAVGPIGLLRPELVRPVFVAAMVVTFPIGWMVSQVVLAVLYYGVFMPLGLVFRLVGRDPLELKRQHGRASYWSPKPAPETVRRYFRQY
jgi:hypothetical protein